MADAVRFPADGVRGGMPKRHTSARVVIGFTESGVNTTGESPSHPPGYHAPAPFIGHGVSAPDSRSMCLTVS